MADWEIVEGDCVEQMRAMPTASIDAVVCDPPYGLEFMGKDWDRLSDDAVTRSWDARGRTMTDAPRAASSVRLYHKDNPRCDKCGRAINGRATAKGFKVCECPEPAPRLPATSARKMQAWHEAWAREAFRVLKPGGHLLAFGGTRTYHRLTCAVEDAGFEIRDTIAWMYGSGFPKSLDVSKQIDAAAGATREPGEPGRYAARRPREDVQAVSAYHDGVGDAASALVTKPATPDAERWQGWGTALKPAHEPIVVARKPLAGTVAANVLAHGTGALNVGECRVAHNEECRMLPDQHGDNPGNFFRQGGRHGETLELKPEGRWPANVVLDPEAAAVLDEQTGDLHSQDPRTRQSASKAQGVTLMGTGESIEYGDSGGASRFFYVAKASSAERNAGLDGFEEKATRDTYGDGLQGPRPHTSPDYEWQRKGARNTHPTVKPIALMRWLVRLVTPPGGTCLDPFAGSGTTGAAAVLEGFRFVGIEREAEYAAIARARIAWWSRHPDGVEIVKALEAEKVRTKIRDSGQESLFG